METIQIKDKIFRPYMSVEDINEILDSLSAQLNRDYADKDPLLIIVLNGAFIFAADLCKKLTIPCRLSLIKVSSYQGTESTNQISNLIGLKESLKNEHIIIVEDIIDTGNTMEYLLKTVSSHQPASMAICSLLFKPNSFSKDYKINYIGRSIPDDFVVGYGFDYDGYGRNLPCIYQLNA
ncbi:MAG: hypoxanthine phosphoribosyltransferase [Bacteroidales bacterium]